jgi:NAD(P)-dependent dehydrogenase (short-subunit alcohol dehydrogenase family)
MRTIVITGSGSGLGAAIRARIEAAGDRVVGVDLRGQEIDADLATATGRSAAMNAVLEATEGSIDGLVVCAGLGPHVQPRSQLVAVNYYGAVEVLDGLRPALAAGERPAAVAISSNSIGMVPIRDTSLIDAMLDGAEAEALALAPDFDGSSVYAMTKIALARAVRRRAEGWGRAGVRLNAIAPGPVNTPLLQGSLDDAVLGPLVDALPIPLDRRADPDDVAGAVVFLLGPDAGFVHGSVLFADGGTDAVVRPTSV